MRGKENTCARKLLVCAVLLFWIHAGCKPRQVAVPPPTAKTNSEAGGYVAAADARAQDLHLYGWRKADGLYQKAYDLSGSPEIRKKLLLNRFLIFVRQIDEDIPYPDSDDLIRELCAGDAYEKTICEIAQWYEKGTNAGALKLGSPALTGKDSVFDSYLNLILFDAVPRRDAFPQSKNAPSPLFLYLNPGRLLGMDTAEFEKNYPEFAEAYDKIADAFFQKKKYRAARIYFQKAIDLIPDYTHAIIGLGNIYYYALEDFERSLRYYDTALQRDASNPAALWGKAMSLHQMGKYDESNEAAEQLLGTPVTRGRWIGDIPDSRYYQGQGNYIKAYNYHLMKDPARARESVDLAKKFLPDYEGANFLSGLLFYQARDLERAREDFSKAIQRGYNCSAQLHLGLIYRQFSSTEAPFSKDNADKNAVTYLLGAASCMESAVLSIRSELVTLDSIDLEAKERFVLRGRLQKKLQDEHYSSCSTIEMIISELSKDGTGKQSVYLNLLNEILTRLRNMDLRLNQ